MSDFEKNDQEITNKEKFLFVMSYFPLVNIGLFFLEIDRSPKMLKFLYQGVTLFAMYVVGNILLNMIWGGLGTLFTLCYLGLIAYLAGNAYKGEYVEISYVSQIINKFFSK